MSIPAQPAQSISQQTNIRRKYSLVMTQADVQSVSVENEITTVKGNAGFTIQGNNFSGQNRVIPDFREDIRGCFELNPDSKTTELECEISLDEAKKLILAYISTHAHPRTSDIIIDLCLDPELVVEALNNLREENKIEGMNV